MNNVVVWLDPKEAYVFTLKTAGVEKSHLKKESVDHHRRHKKDIHMDSNEQHYYHELALRLHGTDRLFLLGPSQSKTHFKNYLETHDDNGLAKKIIGLEILEHVTDNQILAAARKSFQKYDLFNG